MATINKSALLDLGKCPVCSSIRRKTLFPTRSSSVKSCCDCLHTYLDPCLSPNAMKEAYESESSLTQIQTFHEGYYRYGDLEKSSKTLDEFAKGLHLAASVLPTPAPHSIFDVGYGNGLFLAYAKKKGWIVDGIDSSATNQKIAKDRFSLDVRQGAFETFSVPDNKYDVVSFLDVIEHLPDPHATLSQAGQMLKPGGLLLIAVPNDNNLMSFIIKGMRKFTFGLMAPGADKIYFLEHVSYFTLSSLQKLCQQNGFVLKGHFYSSTDLDKYTLPPMEKILATLLLFLGRLSGLQNRLVAVFQK